MKAWHFIQYDKRLRWKCGRHRIVKPGLKLTVDPNKLKLCEYGLHASKRALDALTYAPGAIICRVELGGKILKGDDKVVASERTVLWMADATRTLHEFACDVAEEALRAGNVTDERSWDAIKIKRLWLDGKATSNELGAARAATWDAARDAAWDAARAATWDAARDAAWDAAWYAGWYAGRDALNRRLTRRLDKLGKKK